MPQNLEIVDPQARTYPASWKDAAIRAQIDSQTKEVRCPICKKTFRGNSELRMLQADHIVPWTQGGFTTWENMQLLCRACNRAKYNHMPMVDKK